VSLVAKPSSLELLRISKALIVTVHYIVAQFHHLDLFSFLTPNLQIHFRYTTESSHLVQHVSQPPQLRVLPRLRQPLPPQLPSARPSLRNLQLPHSARRQSLPLYPSETPREERPTGAGGLIQRDRLHACYLGRLLAAVRTLDPGPARAVTLW